MDFKEKYNYWLEDDFFDEETKKELESIKDDPKEIQERFYQDLTFGTAGLRGKLGAGTNRMNKYTVARASQGLAETIVSHGSHAMEKGVAIAYDVRHRSKEFAEIASRVLAANGVKVYLFDDIRPTPVLSYTVRKLSTMSGIVVTASHNPRDYNGYKVYWEEGSQILDSVADDILKNISKLDYKDVKLVDLEEGLSSGRIQYISSEIDQDYMDDIESLSINEDIDKDIKIVYTPLNGTGNKFVREILKRRGFNKVYVVEEQENPDPDFTTVGYPNPEDVKAFDYSIRLGKKVKGDILIATDPDCDRLACMIKDADDEYVSLNGNQVGALLVHYILSSRDKLGSLPDRGAIVKSIVTGDLSKAIAKRYGVETIDTLTGFKHICGKANEFEKTKEYNFIFGYEESIGYNYGTFVRDKDGVVSSMLLAEMAGYYSSLDKTILDVLDEIYEEYGYYFDELMSISLVGIEGKKRIERIMDNFRKEPIEEIADIKLVKTIDYLLDETGNPKSNVLKYYFDDESWYAVRPSGTEPKIKIYIYSKDKDEKASREKISQIKASVLARIESIK